MTLGLAQLVSAVFIAGTPGAGAHQAYPAGMENELALRAADRYIMGNRRADVSVRLPGVAPGTPVHVRLKRHAFHFGINVPGTFNRFLIEGAPPDSEAARFQRFVLDHFNTVVPSNGGKWLYNEGTRGFVTMDYVDLILRWAARHRMFARMHTLLWDHEQQPVWVQDLLRAAVKGDAAAKDDLLRAIDRRIEYYVRDRAGDYQELDVLNESIHRGGYVAALGEAGVADLFNRVARTAREARVPLRLFLNEYDLLQNSADPSANWYRRHIDRVRAAGGEVSGIGVQYYADARAAIATPHSPARIAEVLRNLTATGLPVELTEFGVKKGASRAEAARVLDETMRMVFGTPGTIGFVMFGFWAGAIWDTAPEAVLVDADWNLTEAGAAYEKLMAAWTTDVTVPMRSDGAIEFIGFYGDYVIDVAGRTFSFELVRGKREYDLR